MTQFMIFCTVGIANTAVGLALIFALKFWAGMHDAWANPVGYAAGMTLSFVLNKTLTFSHSGDVRRSAFRFALVQAIAYLLNLTTVMWLIAAGVDSYLAQALGVVPYTVAGFLGARFFAFPSFGPAASPRPADAAATVPRGRP